jgi:hypothetical protein
VVIWYIFPSFGMLCPRKIWQPWIRRKAIELKMRFCRCRIINLTFSNHLRQNLKLLFRC